MNRCGYFFLLLAVPTMCPAAAPTPVGKIELNAPLAALRASWDGKRAVALLLGSEDRPGGLAVIDTSTPQAPIARGFLADVSGSLVVAPDGRRALIVTQLEEEKFNTATRHEVIAVDISDADRPKVAWRRESAARSVVLAPDATAYAASEPVRSKEGMWRTTINWVSGNRPALIVEESPYAPADMQLSAGGTFLATPSFGNQLRIVDLRSAEPIVYEQEYVFYQRYKCMVAVLRDGHVVIDDNRAPRLGIYAPGDDDVLRAGVLLHDASEHCQQLDADPDGGSLILAVDPGRLRRVDMRQPSRPVLTGTWQLPLSTYPRSVAGSLLYAAAGPHGSELQIFRLDVPAASSVDWVALAAVHRAAMDRYNRELRERKPVPDFKALRQLEDAGVVQALDAPLSGISPQRAAAILNDYGFLAFRVQPNLAEVALRRAMDLDPNRALAALNLADGLRERLSAWSDPATTPARVSEIGHLYRKYLASGGKSNPRIERENRSGGNRARPVSRLEPGQRPALDPVRDICYGRARKRRPALSRDARGEHASAGFRQRREAGAGGGAKALKRCRTRVRGAVVRRARQGRWPPRVGPQTRAADEVTAGRSVRPLSDPTLRQRAAILHLSGQDILREQTRSVAAR